MPFETGAHIEVFNACDELLRLYYYMDYETYPPGTAMDDYGRFHAQWRRVNPTAGLGRSDCALARQP